MNLLVNRDSLLTTDTFQFESFKYKKPELKLDGSKKKRALFFLWLYAWIESAATAMAFPLIPAEALRHDVEQIIIGLLFFLFSLSVLVTSLSLGQLLSFIGRRNAIFISYILKIFSFIGFIFIQNIQSKTMFILVFAIIHILQGVSTGWLRTSTYSALTSMYSDSINFSVSWFETAYGIGFSFGPAVGSLLFGVGGYQLPFLSFLAVIILLTVLAMILIPCEINMNKHEV